MLGKRLLETQMLSRQKKRLNGSLQDNFRAGAQFSLSLSSMTILKIQSTIVFSLTLFLYWQLSGCILLLFYLNPQVCFVKPTSSEFSARNFLIYIYLAHLQTLIINNKY